MRIKHLPLATAIAIMASLVITVIFSCLIGFLSWSSNRTAVKQVHEHLSQQMSAIAIALEDNFLSAQQSAKLRFGMYKHMLPSQSFTVTQEGAPSEGLLRDWPSVGSGVHKHYGYAFQWFGLCGLVALLYVWFQFVRRA